MNNMIKFLKEFFRTKADERILQEGYKIEHYAFWAMFFTAAFFAVMPFECLAGRDVAVILLLEGGIISGFGYYKAGIWNFNEKKPTILGNLIWSILFTVVFAVPFSLKMYSNFMESGNFDAKTFALIIVFFVVFLLIFLFVLLTFFGFLMNKRQHKLDEEFLDADEK